MSQAASMRTHPFTVQGLRTRTRTLHTPRVIWANPGWICVGAALGLSVLGVAAIGTTEPGYALRHLALLCVGLCACSIAVAPHFRIMQRLSTPLMMLVLALLVFVLLPWVPEFIVRPRNGARRWINLWVTDFQPSELAKITYVISLAAYLRYRSNYRSLRGLLLPLLLSFIPMGLVLVEPDLGTSLLFLPTFFAMLIVAGAKLKHVVLIVLLGLAAAPMLYPLLGAYQKKRIIALVYQFKGDPRYEEGIGFQGARAMMLVGAGQMAGMEGRHAADLVEHNGLPEDHNDMIFAVVSCRWGMLGALATIGGFALMVLGGLLTSARCKDPFGRLVAVGIVAVLFAQMTINIGMTVGLMPITGMTLPFVSYGGSSLVTAWIMVGIVLNIALRRPPPMMRESFEFDMESAGA